MNAGAFIEKVDLEREHENKTHKEKTVKDDHHDDEIAGARDDIEEMIAAQEAEELLV